MAQYEFDNTGRYVNADWHQFRAEARRTAMSEAEFDPIERERYDLDTAGINGEENPEVYITEPFGPDQSIDRRDTDLMG